MAKEKLEWNEDDIGARVIYTARSGKQSQGTIRGVTHISEQCGYMLDVDIDGSMRARFYVPADMVTLVPDELSDTLREDT